MTRNLHDKLAAFDPARLEKTKAEADRLHVEHLARKEPCQFADAVKATWSASHHTD